jgi:hypothetical protein
MLGIMDCATSSRMNVRRELTSDSKRYGVGSSSSSAISVALLGPFDVGAMEWYTSLLYLC